MLEWAMVLVEEVAIDILCCGVLVEVEDGAMVNRKQP
jgi:hypothetical protein